MSKVGWPPLPPPVLFLTLRKCDKNRAIFGKKREKTLKNGGSLPPPKLWHLSKLFFKPSEARDIYSGSQQLKYQFEINFTTECWQGRQALSDRFAFESSKFLIVITIYCSSNKAIMLPLSMMMVAIVGNSPGGEGEGNSSPNPVSNTIGSRFL